MKQILIISGKGGTGKTVVTASLASLFKGKVIADCDVDAPNLHILMNNKINEKIPFKSGFTALIDEEECTECGKCYELCRFNAITENFKVDAVACEGCAFCSHICPVSAIEMVENLSGELFISTTDYGPLVHAKLGIGEENSGKLVTLVKHKAKEISRENNFNKILIDGSPGIGCPVISSLSGVDLALVVTEPSLSGIHDAQRVIGVATHFGVEVKVIVNKYDLNMDICNQIEKYCSDNEIELLGKIPFDENVVKAMVNGIPVVDYEDSPAREEILKIFEKLNGK